MERNEFYKVLGRITYSFSNIDFLMSNIATNLQITNNPYQFFAISNFKKKIETLRRRSEVIQSRKIKSEFINWLQNLDELREKRNTVVHSIILTNAANKNEFKLYNYRKSDTEIISEINDFTSQDFYKLDKDLVELYNEGMNLIGKIEDNIETV